MKKDSIVTVSNFGNITHSLTIIPSTIRRATIGSKFTRLYINVKRLILKRTSSESFELSALIIRLKRNPNFKQQSSFSQAIE